MKWSIRIARIAGVEVELHLTFLVFLIIQSLRPRAGKLACRLAYR